MKIEFCHPHAQMPTRGSLFAAGYDIYSCEEMTIPAWGQCTIHTGIRIELEKNTYGRLASRSGLAVKYGIEVGAGVIDEDYRGEILVLLHNMSDASFDVYIGMRIAQLIISPYYSPILQLAVLSDTARGECGFGSTGV